MGPPLYSGYENYLAILARSNTRNITSLIQSADFKTVKVIVEILVNILKGIIQLKEKELEQFRPFKLIVNKLISTKTRLAGKKRILSDNPVLVKFAARVLLNYIE